MLHYDPSSEHRSPFFSSIAAVLLFLHCQWVPDPEEAHSQLKSNNHEAHSVLWSILMNVESRSAQWRLSNGIPLLIAYIPWPLHLTSAPDIPEGVRLRRLGAYAYHRSHTGQCTNTLARAASSLVAVPNCTWCSHPLLLCPPNQFWTLSNRNIERISRKWSSAHRLIGIEKMGKFI